MSHPAQRSGHPAGPPPHRSDAPAPPRTLARLSPLKHRNLNLLGRYSFTASTPAAGALRPLRAPDTVELDEDDAGAPV
ncbi:hypothetical protein IPZ58_25405 [Streptomyces roseoverticillatus]|uniref:hypothetical protein n=1 Tax=Streptomyces roseoverticillatus TaxID=66429 RepID=UPI001F394897|nr:hypothetical protein [Streptomyces roseoverticillatus]MCF3104900.1 hypothetical protein [Streptomyces roseoverticillatus]